MDLKSFNVNFSKSNSNKSNKVSIEVYETEKKPLNDLDNIENKSFGDNYGLNFGNMSDQMSSKKLGVEYLKSLKQLNIISLFAFEFETFNLTIFGLWGYFTSVQIPGKNKDQGYNK